MASRSPLRCPRCNHNLPRDLWFWSTWWTRLRCEGCGSLLRVNRHGRAVVIVTMLGASLLLPCGGVLLFGLSLVMLSVVVGVIMVGSFTLWWRLDRWLVVEPVGSYCAHCAYNLAGIVSGQCPECGKQTASEDPIA